MRLPFDAEQFFQVFSLYNTAVWPAQILLSALALAAVVLAIRGRENDSRGVAGILALLWLWNAVVYHLVFFRSINPAATLFAAAFAVEAFLLLWIGAFRSRLQFKAAPNLEGVLGALIISYAVVGYPVIAAAFGQRYPAMPTFGVPCPTVIFTLGLLLWSTSKAVRWVVAIPIVWAAIAMQVAIRFGVAEDWGLAVAASIVLGLLVMQRRSVYKFILKKA